MELALGTVQFGLKYGLSPTESLLSDQEIRELIEYSYNNGISVLDTAPDYGDIESRLTNLSAGMDFRIVSKIPPIPETLNDSDACHWAVESARKSKKRLGRRLYALLFHRAEDLRGLRGASVWGAMAAWAADENVRVGASGYDVVQFGDPIRDLGMMIGQLPANALDQRVLGLNPKRMPGFELHSRSAFLQGLLLLPIEQAISVLPSGSTALRKWHAWLRRQRLSPLEGALTIVKSFDNVSVCVIGVDNKAQLMELVQVWRAVSGRGAPELKCDNLEIIDPRLWRPQQNETRGDNPSADVQFPPAGKGS